MKSLSFLLFAFWCCCCSTDKEKDLASAGLNESNLSMAQVSKISVSGSENAYSFSVTVESPDTGCDQYADWWEIIDLDGNLIYRRVLTHSHATEQPFTRTGSNINLEKNTEVYVRAHMNTSGYGAKVQKGSVENGFTAAELDIEFAKELQNKNPLPNGCEF